MTSNGMPVETIKLKIINNLTRLYPLLSNELQVYFASGLNSILILDEMLLFELNKLDHQNNSSAYQQLLKQDENSFETGFRANLLFHFMRIKEDILYSKEKIEKEFMKNNSINGLNLFAYKDDLEKRTKKLLLELVKMSKPLKTSFQKLQNITSDGDYSSSDEGSENVVAILSQYEEISLQVYGKWGYEFLEYTTDESEDRNDDFIKKFNKFAKDHLSVRTNSEGLDYYQIIAPSDLSELRVMYACQDAMPFRRIFKHSDALVQQGHDFVETNKRLFHSDVPQGLLGVKSKFRHIQNHHKSSIFAKKIINGETVAQKYIDKYINKTYTSKRKKYLGKMMIKIHNSRKKATLLQTLIDRYNCNSITLDEK